MENTSWKVFCNHGRLGSLSTGSTKKGALHLPHSPSRHACSIPATLCASASRTAGSASAAASSSLLLSLLLHSNILTPFSHSPLRAPAPEPRRVYPSCICSGVSVLGTLANEEMWRWRGKSGLRKCPYQGIGAASVLWRKQGWQLAMKRGYAELSLTPLADNAKELKLSRRRCLQEVRSGHSINAHRRTRSAEYVRCAAAWFLRCAYRCCCCIACCPHREKKQGSPEKEEPQRWFGAQTHLIWRAWPVMVCCFEFFEPLESASESGMRAACFALVAFDEP